MKLQLLTVGILVSFMTLVGCRSTGTSALSEGGFGNTKACQVVVDTCDKQCMVDLGKTAVEFPRLMDAYLLSLGTRLLSPDQANANVDAFIKKIGASGWGDIDSQKFIGAFKALSPNGDGAEGLKIAMTSKFTEGVKAAPASERARVVMGLASSISGLMADAQMSPVKALVAQALMQVDVTNLTSGTNSPEMRLAQQAFGVAKNTMKLVINSDFKNQDQMNRFLQNLAIDTQRNNLTGEGAEFQRIALSIASSLTADLEVAKRVAAGSATGTVPQTLADMHGSNAEAQRSLFLSAVRSYATGKSFAGNAKASAVVAVSKLVAEEAGKAMDADRTFAAAAGAPAKGFGAAIRDTSDLEGRVNFLSTRNSNRNDMRSAAQGLTARATQRRVAASNRATN